MPDLNERLEKAALSLAGPGSIKDRLGVAYMRNLADLREQDFPDEIRGEFASLFNILHKERALPGEDIVRASIRKLSPAQAQSCAERLVRLYGRIAHGLNGSDSSDSSGQFAQLRMGSADAALSAV